MPAGRARLSLKNAPIRRGNYLEEINAKFERFEVYSKQYFYCCFYLRRRSLTRKKKVSRYSASTSRVSINIYIRESYVEIRVVILVIICAEDKVVKCSLLKLMENE